MSPKQPAKQKRASQNRSQRAALAARTANAKLEAGQPSAGGSGGGTRKPFLSRLWGSPGRTPSTSVGAARARGAELRGQPPGYRAALSAVLAGAAAVVLCTFGLRYPVDAEGDLYTSETVVADWSITALDAVAEQPDADAAEVAESIDEWAPGREKETVVKALWPYSLAIVLPLIGAGLGFHAVRRRASSKVVNRALYATLFGAVLTQGLLLLFLPVVIGLGVAMFQVRKAETMAAAMEGATDVIDVEEADGDLLEDAELVRDSDLVEDAELAAEDGFDDADDPARDR